MAADGPIFLDDPAKIAVNPTTRQTTLFSFLMTAKDGIFMATFAHIPGERERKSTKSDPSLVAIRV